VENEVGHSRTIVIGDLNMNPFEDGLVSSEGFHAVMSRKLAKEGSRTVHEQSRKFFYNPMWSRFGEHPHRPPGTYFYRGSVISYFWNIYDQVLVRPELLNRFDDDGLSVLTKAGPNNLASATGAPDKKSASDHFPILLKLKAI